MPNANVLKQKQEQVAALAEKMKNSAAGVVVDYRGITVADDTKLRRELREAGVEYAVIKNNILRRAAEEAGLGELTAHMVGTTAFAYSPEDPIAAAKILNKFAEASKDKFEIRAGYMDAVHGPQRQHPRPGRGAQCRQGEEGERGGLIALVLPTVYPFNILI